MYTIYISVRKKKMKEYFECGRKDTGNSTDQLGKPIHTRSIYTVEISFK